MPKRQGPRPTAAGARPVRRPPQVSDRAGGPANLPGPSTAPVAPARQVVPPISAPRPAPPAPATPAPPARDRATVPAGRNGPLPAPRPVSPRVPVGSPAHLPPLSHSAGAVRARESARLFGDYSYVQRDLRRIAVLTVAALVLLVVISFVLPHLTP